MQSERLVVLRTTVPVAGPAEFPRAIATYRGAARRDARDCRAWRRPAASRRLPTAVRSNGGYWIQGGPGPEVLGMKSPQAVFNVVTPDYFEALRVPVVRGRDFNEGDRLDAPFVALVNEQLVTGRVPGRRSDRPHHARRTRQPEPMTIVGIVKDVRTRGPARPVQAETVHAVRAASRVRRRR